MTPAPLLRFEGVTLAFGAVEVLGGIDFEVREGEFVALVGPSGLRQDDAAEPVLGVVVAEHRARSTGRRGCGWCSSRTACFRG